MKILITCYNLNLSGSSTFTYTLATELQEQGHDVSVFCFKQGEVSEKLIKKNIFVTNHIKQLKTKTFDSLILQHNLTAICARGVFPNTPAIYISHGIIPELEAPPSCDINIQAYIAVSEEIKNHLINQHQIAEEKISLIRNFIDTKRFKSEKEIKTKVKKILYLSYHDAPKTLEVIKAACGDLGIDLQTAGQRKRVFEVETKINQADLVISLGRGILESMSCGRAVLVCDMDLCEGIITQDNYKDLRRHNFSGRCKKTKLRKDILKNEVSKYQQGMGRVNRKFIKQQHDARKSTADIVRIIKNASKNFKPKSINLPNKEILSLFTQLQRQGQKIENFQKQQNSTWKIIKLLLKKIIT